MMFLFSGKDLVATFESNAVLASYLIAHPDTHDYGPDGLRFREPYRLECSIEDRR